MRRGIAVAVLVAVAAVLAAACGADDNRLSADLGGETTRREISRNSFGLPAPTLTDEERREFEVGDSFFTKNWVRAPASTESRDGLGPVFNAQACSSCHVLDGRGAPPEGPTDQATRGLLLRLSVPGDTETGAPAPDPSYGGQLQDRSIDGVPAEGTLVVTYEEEPGTYGDGTPYSLRRPSYLIDDLAFGPLDPEIMVSPRLAPQVIGMGLLEAVPEDEILERADPDDEDADGISGRPNRVWDQRLEDTALGRFGWKANVATVEQQTAGAFLGDIGITSGLNPEENCPPSQAECAAAISGGSPEVADERLGRITFYARTLSVPAMRDHEDAEVTEGAAVFEELGCSSCHTPTLHTGEADVVALSNQTIHPYTDLLLHDMGDGLADGRPDFEASGSEWRTPPLWGLGLVDDINGALFLLHDGRARTFEEAILWHGGEAEEPREAFRLADAEARAALVRFLESL